MKTMKIKCISVDNLYSCVAVLYLLLISRSALAIPGDTLWSKSTGGNFGSSIAMNNAQTRLYLGAADNYIYSYDTSGVIQWRFDTGGYVGSTPSVSQDDATIYVGSNSGSVFAIDALTGVKKWQFTTGASVYGSPAIAANGVVIVGSADASVYAIDQTNGGEVWRYVTGGNVGSSPAVGFDGSVYVGSAGGYLYALNINGPDGSRLKWRYLTTTDMGVTSPAIGADGIIYAGSFDGSLYALKPTGSDAQRLKWSVNLGGRIASAPAISVDGTIYIGSYDNGLLNAVNSDDGSIVWTFPAGGAIYSSPAIGADGTVLFGSFDNTVYALDPSLFVSGVSVPADLIKWSFTTDDTVVSSPTIGSDSTVYISSLGSTLYAIEDNSGGLAGAPWPMFGYGIKHAARIVDTDGDGIPDGYEYAAGLNPGDIADGVLDSDADTLSNVDEFLAGTNPNSGDTDGDSLGDAFEVAGGLDPLDDGSADTDQGASGDPDLDGHTNLAESLVGSMPGSKYSQPLDLNLQLTPGLQIVFYPKDLPAGFSAYDLIASLNRNGESVTEIQSIETGSLVKSSQWVAGAATGDDFSLAEGQAVTARVSTDTTLTFQGAVNCPSINLVAGLNVIGLRCMPAGYTAFQLLSAIGSSGVVSTIQRYNVATGRYQTASYHGIVAAGNDFSLTQGEAYFINMKQDRSSFDPLL